MISKLIFVLTSLVSIGFCVEICTNKSPCKCVLSTNEVIDISSVGLLNFPRFYEIQGFKNDTHLYSYNPCYSFTSPAHEHTIQKTGKKPCVNAAACIRSPGGSTGELPEEYVIGVQAEGVFGSTSGETTMYHINYTVPGTERVLIVNLECADKSEEHILTVETEETDNSHLTIMKLQSKCACPNLCAARNPDEPEDEGMSTGSKLLIAFFTIVLAYFIIGIGWNFCNGAKGLELVPNYEFWNELPKLIVEGIAFTCSCFGRRTAYGEV